MKYNRTKYRVAVLIAGQSRSYKKCLPALADFFSEPFTSDGELEVQVDYFMHTWDVNTWLDKDTDKSKDSYFTSQEPAFVERYFVEKSLKSLKGFQVEQYSRANPHRVWGGILYSSYKVNKLKSDYENEYGVCYDLVIRTRPDIVFRPNERLVYNQHEINHRTIYTTGRIEKMKNELYISNLDDVIYMGDSATMNTAANLYKYAGVKVCDPPIGVEKNNLAPVPERHLGPGTLMTRYLNLLNISVESVTDKRYYIVVRKAGIDLNLNYKDNFNELEKIHKDFYIK